MKSFTSTRPDASVSNGATVSPLRGSPAESGAEARQWQAEAEEFLRNMVVNRPVTAVGVALAVGVILGWLIKRR
jgi:ElaB/YqjD/DUF883 family membrane-anchored ribosome-binding protein